MIGGAEVYAAALPLADELLLTEVELDVEGDTFFPPYDPAVFVTAERDAARLGRRNAVRVRAVRTPHPS